MIYFDPHCGVSVHDCWPCWLWLVRITLRVCSGAKLPSSSLRSKNEARGRHPVPQCPSKAQLQRPTSLPLCPPPSVSTITQLHHLGDLVFNTWAFGNIQDPNYSCVLTLQTPGLEGTLSGIAWKFISNFVTEVLKDSDGVDTNNYDTNVLSWWAKNTQSISSVKTKLEVSCSKC